MKNKLLYFIISLLGFGVVSCDNEGNTMCEYGTPYAEFEVKGYVKEAETGNPIKGIKVSLSGERISSGYVITDDDGSYAIIDDYISASNQRLVLEATDIDGEDNGGYFATKTTVIDLGKEDFQGASGGWYFGKAEKVVNFELSPAQEDERDDFSE